MSPMKTGSIVQLAMLGLMWLHLAAVGNDQSVIVAGGDHDFPPYEYIDEEGRPSGFNVELLRAVAEEAGLEVRHELGSWQDGREAIAEGAIDVLAMYQAEFREQAVDFATPHVIIYHEIFIPRSAPSIDSVADLTGKRIVVQEQAYIHELFEDMELEAQLVLADTERAALEMLATGQYDAAVVSEFVGRRILGEEALDNLTTSGPPLFPVEYALAVTQGNEALLQRINEGLVAIKASSRFNELHRDWLRAPRQPAAAAPDRRIWIMMAIVVLVAVSGVIFWFSGYRVVRRARQLEQALQRQTGDSDILTGLPSRGQFERKLQQFIEDARSRKRQHGFIYIDLDQFKLINESIDHQTGDRLLRELSTCLKSSIGPAHFLARLGGDEFAVLIIDRDETEVMDIAEALRKVVTQFTFSDSNRPFQITASIGVTLLQPDTKTIGDLFKQAEAACNAAKEWGRNRVHLYHPDDEMLALRHGQIHWITQIQAALDDDSFELHYQTIEPLGDRVSRPSGIELLLRMLREDGKPVSAGEFMPAAENHFIAHRIDRWVIDHALQWLDSHGEVLGRFDPVFVNISARSLSDDRFLPWVLERLARYRVAPGRLVLELTETAVMSNFNQAMTTMRSLRETGCRFALDDFGVGISSMAYLKNLPVDFLKIDGSFCRAAVNSSRERALLSEINDLGHVLGKITIAEHVETESILKLCEQIGIDMAQGYALSRPRPLQQMLDNAAERTA